MRENAFNALSILLSKSWRKPHFRVIYFHGVAQEHIWCFADILERFREAFEIVPYSEGLKRLSDRSIRKPLMAVTFDDADHTVAEHALPILKSYGIRPCIFVVADYVNRGTTYREKRPRKVMSWSDLNQCLQSGCEIGNHTFTHPNLTALNPTEILEEVRRNREVLQDRIGEKIVHFAYPYGQFNRTTLSILRKSGLCETQATTQRGQMYSGHDLHFIRRDRIDLQKSPTENEALMRLADRLYWLRGLRSLRSAFRIRKHSRES